MPFFSSKKKPSKEAKQRLERLMIIAREHPDKIFDLSSCEISAVPTSLFSQCRIFLTESLLLHTNNLKDLKAGGLLADLQTLRVSVR